jgi:hypothetical protein
LPDIALRGTKQGGASPPQSKKKAVSERSHGPKLSQAVIEQRRLEVLHYHMRGLTPDEILQNMKNPPSRRTLFYDLAYLKKWIKKGYAEERGYTLDRAMLELEELWRELWRIFHNPIVDAAVAFQKLGAIDRLLRILQIKASLMGLFDSEVTRLFDEIQTNFLASKARIEAAVRDAIARGANLSATPNLSQPAQRSGGVDEKMPNTEGGAVQLSGSGLPSSDLPGTPQTNNSGERPPGGNDGKNHQLAPPKSNN